MCWAVKIGGRIEIVEYTPEKCEKIMKKNIFYILFFFR